MVEALRPPEFQQVLMWNRWIEFNENSFSRWDLKENAWIENSSLVVLIDSEGQAGREGCPDFSAAIEFFGWNRFGRQDRFGSLSMGADDER
jgi:hypothetical protein